MQRSRFEDHGAGPSHAPPTAAGDDADLVRRFETIFRDVPEGMWTQIQDEEFLEQCIGLPPPWRSIMRRAAVFAAMTSGRLPPGQGGPADAPPPPAGAGGGGPPPPPEGGAAGGDLQILRNRQGGTDLMTLVRGHLMLLRWQPEGSWMIYSVGLRRCFGTCLRACGSVSRTRSSWSSVSG